MLVSEIPNARFLGQITGIQVSLYPSHSTIYFRIANNPFAVPLTTSKGAVKRFRSLSSLLKIINYTYQQPVSHLLTDPLLFPAELYPISV